MCMGGKRGSKEGGRHASRKDRGRGVGKIKADVALREMEEERRRRRIKGRTRGAE